MNEEEMLAMITAFLRAQGFSIPKKPSLKKEDLNYKTTSELPPQCIEMAWDFEPATGMAAFSQERVAVRGCFFLEDGIANPLKISLGVRYQHPDGGSNGYDRLFKVKNGVLVAY